MGPVWWEQADAALTKLMSVFLPRQSFPPGHNTVTLTTDERRRVTDALVDPTPIHPDLTTLYWVISEACLPDVDSGYFIHSAATTGRHVRECAPARIEGESIALVFAGGGAGRLFAIGDSGQVWESTTASWSDDFRVAAVALQNFLEQFGRRDREPASLRRRHAERARRPAVPARMGGVTAPTADLWHHYGRTRHATDRAVPDRSSWSWSQDSGPGAAVLGDITGRRVADLGAGAARHAAHPASRA